MHILIADDDPISREITLHILIHAGYRVTAVNDGAAALQALLTGDFAIALLDLYMPSMRGDNVAQAVTARLSADKRPLLIGFSAMVTHHDEDQGGSVGFDAYLSKPLQIEAFKKLSEQAASTKIDR